MKSKTLSLFRNLKRKQAQGQTLPAIPEKRYFTIGEVARLCCVKAHVLRYWEQEFYQLKPNKRRGNRRYYQYEDVILVRKIRKLLYEDAFTIEGARGQMQTNPAEAAKSEKTDDQMKKLIADLEGILQQLRPQEIVG